MEASVYAEPAKRYDGGVKQVVEVLRFITGYRTGLEVLVDLTPFSPLLDAVSTSAEIEAFAFIDTWVGKSTGYKTEEYLEDAGSDMRLLANSSGVRPCSLRKEGHVEELQGNGWSVSADLVLWPAGDGDDDTRPRASITLASGPVGSSYQVGTTRYHEGWSVDGGRSILLDKPVELGSDARNRIFVYRCPSGGLRRARQLSTWAKEVLGLAGPLEVRAYLGKLVQRLQREQLEDLKVKYICAETNLLVCERSDGLEVQPSMAVYHNSKISGHVLHVDGETFSVRLEVGCLPMQATVRKLQLKIPRSPRWLEEISDVLDALQKTATVVAQKRSSGALGSGKVLLQKKTSDMAWLDGADALSDDGPSGPRFLTIENQMLQPLEPLGSIDPARRVGERRSRIRRSMRGSAQVELSNETAAADPRGASLGLLQAVDSHTGTASVGHGQRLCVVEERRTGLIFDRRFDVPVLAEGDRVLLQFVVTGHGWFNTQWRCGEYCHAVYALNFNQGHMFDVILFRDDCKVNPWGPSQAGTWEDDRNGWCPGSVEPGLYIDVTDAIRDGQNELQVDLLVQDNKTLGYEPYYDRLGYERGDTAMVAVAMTLSVYPASAVAAVNAQRAAYTAAEKALRHGSSAVDSATLSEDARRAEAFSFLQRGGEGGTATAAGAGSGGAGDRGEALGLLKHLARRRGARTPMGVMVAHPARRPQSVGLGKQTVGPGSELGELFRRHDVRISEEEFHAALHRGRRGERKDDRASQGNSSLIEHAQKVGERPEEAVLFGNLHPGDRVLLAADSLVVQVKKVSRQSVKVRFPDGITSEVAYQDLRFIAASGLDRQGTCDHQCYSANPLLGDGSCRALIVRHAQLPRVDLSLEAVMDAVNRDCGDTCHCTRRDFPELLGGENPDYSAGCSQRVAPVAAGAAYQNQTHLSTARGAVMDFESAAPWYCYSAARDGPAGCDAAGCEAQRIQVFDHVNVHIGARTVTSKLGPWDLPPGFKWGRAALHLRLDHPRWPGLGEDGRPFLQFFDFWDRLGSFGFRLPGEGQHLSLFPANEKREREWPITYTKDAGRIVAGNRIATPQGSIVGYWKPHLSEEALLAPGKLFSGYTALEHLRGHTSYPANE